MIKYISVVFILIFSVSVVAQVENIPLDNPVYEFFKEMKVKKVLFRFADDNPNLSYFQAANYLKEIGKSRKELSSTEIKLLEKFKVEFIPEESNESNTWNMFGSGKKFIPNMKDFFSNKQKYLFSAGKTGNNGYVEAIGNLYFGKSLKPGGGKLTSIMDGGFRGRGTLFNHLGYSVSWYKGFLFGDKNLAGKMEPKLTTDFKFLENKESNVNYDNTASYVKYYAEPLEDFGLSAQFGREKITYGYGYSGKPYISGNNPDMDFLKMNFDYGVVNLSSIFASTVGNFDWDYTKRYTKYISAHKLKVSIKDLFDIGYTDIVVYNGRIDFAYLNPILVWHFAEKSLQDRDNKNVALDIQTRFLKNVELQGTLFIDDDEQFSLLAGKTSRKEKFAYQVGTFIYEPLTIKNLALQFEYSKVRPYTYSHYDPKDTYTAYGICFGDQNGPNSDQVFTKLSYNISDWGKFNLEYRSIRKGNNIYDANGVLVKNVGGDINQTFRDNIDDPNASFLEGERINSNVVSLNFRFIPIRNYIFDFYYIYKSDNNITKNILTDESFVYMRMNVQY